MRTLAFAVAIVIAAAARPVTWMDLPGPIQARLQTFGVSSSAFPAFLETLTRAHAARVREGDLDHLVFYLLQSSHFTPLPRVEPALSARTVVETTPASRRQAYLDDGVADLSRVPADVRARARDLLRAIDSSDGDPRLTYFRQLVAAALPPASRAASHEREDALLREYLRAMRFLYKKEFVARRSGDTAAAAVAELYRARGLSTDTAVEAGYVVSLGLGIVNALAPDRRIRRVLIVGPGLDLAPRTGLLDDVPPESYQPWAVIDALVGFGLARLDDLAVVGADINPRVVDHLRRARETPPALHLESGLRETAAVSFEPEYRAYFAQLGNAIAASPARFGAADGRLKKSISVQPSAARVLSAEPLDVVTERLEGETFDLVIATNILPYFDDTELALALSNVAAMLRPGGILLHNEPRPALVEIAASIGLPLAQMRQVPIARVTGAPPLADTIFLHVRR